MKDNEKKGNTIEKSDQASERKKDDLLKAVDIVREEIRSCREKYQKYVDCEEEDKVFIEGETETNFPCHLMVDAAIVAKVYLEYDFPTWVTLGDDAPTGMWDELASICGIKEVCSVDF